MNHFHNQHSPMGYYSLDVAADRRRKEFNIRNHTLLNSQIQPDFLFIGDSITHYWELNAYFHQPDRLVINRGIEGDTTTYLAKRFYTDALQLHPTYCILCIGINDTIELEGDYWKLIPPTPYDEVLSRAKGNITSVILEAKSSSTTLILTSLLPFIMPTSLHEPDRQRFVRELNPWIKKTAQEHGLIFVDYYSATSDPHTGRLLDGITYDGLHPNGRGYNRMAAALRQTLKRHGIAI